MDALESSAVISELSLSSKVILLVGNEFSKVYEKRLAKLNYRVIRFAAGGDALAYLLENTVDLTITVGFALSDMTSRDLVSKLQKDFQTRSRKIMYLYEGATVEGAEAIRDDSGNFLMFPRICPESDFYLALHKLIDE